MLARSALGGIWIYQTYISPRKGYRCAYSVLHGGTGCSGYVKHAIGDNGLLAAIPLIKSRFAACKTANRTLRERHGEPAKTKKRRKDRWYDHCFGGCGPDDCTPDCGSCDCSF